MKAKYLINAVINALPLTMIAALVWQWPNLQKIAFPPAIPTSTEEKLADRIPQNRLPPPTETWRVVKVADGDTITVTSGGRKEKIRFCGIDAPETKHGKQPGQPLGNESRANLQRLIDEAHGEVQLSIVDSDRYGRKVAEVFTVLGDGSEKFLQEEQVKTGFALAYPQYLSSCPNKDSILKAEEIAKRNRFGVWSDPNTVPPWEFRKQQRHNRGS